LTASDQSIPQTNINSPTNDYKDRVKKKVWGYVLALSILSLALALIIILFGKRPRGDLTPGEKTFSDLLVKVAAYGFFFLVFGVLVKVCAFLMRVTGVGAGPFVGYGEYNLIALAPRRLDGSPTSSSLPKPQFRVVTLTAIRLFAAGISLMRAGRRLFG
jgi:hypothetical protein